MTYTHTAAATHTRTYTATYLADVILGSIADILATLGIDVTRLFSTWDIDQAAILSWIEEGSLQCVALECHQPSGAVDPILEFPVAYTTGGEGDRKFTADRAALATYLAKLRRVPAGTTHKIFCTFNGAHKPMPGWSAGRRSSTAGLQGYTFGTLAAAPHASTGLRYFTK